MKHISIITPTARPGNLAHALTYFRAQHTDGIDYEFIVVQEGGYAEFDLLRYGPRFRILRQGLHADCGAAARDLAIREATGEFVAFWDDDNIYHPHALASVLSTVSGHDVGIVRTRHQGLIIPSGPCIKSGDIDTMCFAVRRDLARRVPWVDNGGRFSDYRWITKVAALTTEINRSPVIIGEHL